MMLETHLLRVPPQMAEFYWPHVRDLFERAYAETDMPTPDVVTWLKAGKGILWVVSSGERILGAVTSSLEQRRSGLSCRIEACGGEEFHRWKHHLRDVEAYAKAEGCVKVVFTGRRGWERMLPEYALRRVSLEKGL